jgi:hypothetical protein
MIRRRPAALLLVAAHNVVDEVHAGDDLREMRLLSSPLAACPAGWAIDLANYLSPPICAHH